MVPMLHTCAVNLRPLVIGHGHGKGHGKGNDNGTDAVTYAVAITTSTRTTGTTTTTTTRHALFYSHPSVASCTILP